ncbi:MAG: DUF4129 domain-containing protein [Actinomycetota bacterium]
MRSLTAPAGEDRTLLGVAVAAAVPAALAEAAVFCLPVYTMVTAGAGATIRVAVFLPLFLAAFAIAVALATRYRSSVSVAPLVVVAAIAAGVLLGRGGVQRQVFTVLVFLVVGLRAVALGFRDWREPIAGSFLVGALALAIGSVVGDAAPQDWGPPLIVLMPVFFVGSLASRAVSVWMTDDAEGLAPDERERWLRRAVTGALWVPVAMVAAVGLGLRNGALDHLGSFLAPVGNALVSVLVFVFAQLSRPIFWLVDKLGIDPEGARRVLDRAQVSAARARGRAADQVGHPSLIGRVLGLALFVLAVWAVIRFMRRLTPEALESDRPGQLPAAAVTSGTLAEPAIDAPRSARREPPADRVRRWYGEVLSGLARRGVDKDRAMTPAEFAPEVAEAYPESAVDFDALTRAYEDVRYGSAHLDRAALRELDARRRRIIAALRRMPPTRSGGEDGDLL